MFLIYSDQNVDSRLPRPLPPLPDLQLSEDRVARAAESTRLYVNAVLGVAHDLTIKKDMKVFVEVTAFLISVLVGFRKFGPWIFKCI